MVVVLRSGNIRVVIYLDDHEPAHVHVYGDGEAKVDVSGDRPKLMGHNMSRGALRKALALIQQNRTHLLERWKQIHG